MRLFDFSSFRAKKKLAITEKSNRQNSLTLSIKKIELGFLLTISTHLTVSYAVSQFQINIYISTFSYKIYSHGVRQSVCIANDMQIYLRLTSFCNQRKMLPFKFSISIFHFQ